VWAAARTSAISGIPGSGRTVVLFGRGFVWG
jgi:hypothetical protein